MAACADRDGQAHEGVAERARPKFDHSISWLLAVNGEQVNGFVLATGPGSGMRTDPEDAAVVGLLAVDPAQQAGGVGRALLRAATDQLAALHYSRAVLHALVDNTPAVHLYESEGWRALGEEYEHTLLHRPLRTFARDL
ncbi:GNAT family N-acetyltransferase [Curtobacterium sp. MCBD17_040]|uniref:GNAT family N-acetyltransferase n=1 Tax=Curtobacterium sp. MCBD17_040 TaxID=2175674 RepID=UPI0015E8DB1D|nr:GNAT family N-acetyltransferase [Curtobacterium sp. MCBD17_040]WIB65774.1 GNAT family N-acetyltransferase [Curtobacterium sp. MCBD17_040]